MMSWFTWVLLVYFWCNLLYGIMLMGTQYTFTRVDVLWYACVTGFMTWAAVTQVG